MSNVIKAAAITYTQEKRKIDLNDRADEFARLFIEKHATILDSPQFQEKQDTAGDEFVPGIAGIFTDSSTAQAQEETAAVENAQEEKQRIQEETNQILEEAREEVKRILQEAEKEAASLKQKAVEEGKKQGYAEGKKEADAECSRRLSELQAKEAQLQQSYQEKLEELEPEFVSMVIRLVRKLTGILLEDKRGIILYLLEQLMSVVEPSNTYLIHISSEDYAVAEAKKTELSWKIKEGASLEMIEDRTLKKGQCIIETESRIFDSSLDVQLKNLTSDLKLLAGIREEAE